ncbi:putative nicotinate phosphoribosyltransferase [Mycobacteroides abscessus subsp. bolletii]|uniref:nicotinate phosphoribosyltransferase n=1 Tax=Mycobacteroides abscessus TaxID=36809 RepID=UPI0009B11B89|nr:nicotinate phosphoribosyltransferase [Mycobacteroides abscessus]SLK65899.1 putative nicotinate phosphoribosyltransferase [Mycobacteroides abscessus subsp. bolletii]
MNTQARTADNTNTQGEPMNDKQNRALDTLLATDAYKLDHRRQYPDGTEFVYSNLTARGTRVPGINATVFFGLQAYLQRLTQDWQVFFDLTADELEPVLAGYERFVTALLGPNTVGVQHFRDLHTLGYLPLRVRAVREGSLVPLRVPYLTVENTDSRFFWLTNYFETQLSAELWQPITSATIAWNNRKLLDERAAESGDETAVQFQGHDFSYRGMAGDAAAAASGAGHLISFTGTDGLPAIRFIERFYPGNGEALIGASVPATEHSVMCAGGQDGELATFDRLLSLYPEGILSVVSDTWDLWRGLTEYLPARKEQIMARDGKLVIRPDSGDPELILCGDPAAPEGSPARKGVVNLLAETFGTVTNAKGYRELEPHIGAIYGDSITFERADAITRNLMVQGYASTTVVFGFGSYTYQYQTRDVFKLAVKATWVQIDGVGHDILKDPVTDDGSKKSATGRLAVRRAMSGEPYLIEHADADQEADNELKLVFEDGKLLRQYSFTEVRETLTRETGVYQRYSHSRRPQP